MVTGPLLSDQNQDQAQDQASAEVRQKPAALHEIYRISTDYKVQITNWSFKGGARTAHLCSLGRQISTFLKNGE
jgi:hypothetical protein